MMDKVLLGRLVYQLGAFLRLRSALLLLAVAGFSVTAQAAPRVIVLESGHHSVRVVLEDNATTRDFLSKLPLKVVLSDYRNTEKIAYLPKRLTSQGAPRSYDPKVGDLTYYAPWGNLALFYKDFGDSSGLIKLGVVQEGLDQLDKLDNTTVTIKRAAK